MSREPDRASVSLRRKVLRESEILASSLSVLAGLWGRFREIGSRLRIQWANKEDG